MLSQDMLPGGIMDAQVSQLLHLVENGQAELGHFNFKRVMVFRNNAQLGACLHQLQICARES